jgi:hypothetical protein
LGRVFETTAACPQHTFQVLTKRSRRLRDMASRLPWPKNVWIGVSVEDQRVLGRIDDLREVPASVRFSSCEPLLGPMDGLDLDGMAWVIVGGESGPGARAVKSEWVESILEQCRRAKVAFFFKQWGGTRKSVTGRGLNGRTYDELLMAFAGAGDIKETEMRLSCVPVLLSARFSWSSNLRSLQASGGHGYNGPPEPWFPPTVGSQQSRAPWLTGYSRQ